MEKQAIYTIRVNTNNADKEIQGVTKSMDNLTKSTNKAQSENKSFEDRLNAVNETVKRGEFTMRGANKLIQEYQQIAMQAGRESPVGRQAILAAAQLQDQVTDLRNEVTRLSKDGQAMQGALAIGQTTLAGYTAFKGVTAMLGVENEKLMQTMVKLQAAQATLNAIEQIRAALEKESVLMLTIKNARMKAAALGTMLLAGANKIYAATLGGATLATKLFTVALAMTGIGAIVIGIAALIVHFDKVTAAVKNAATRFQNLGEKTKLVLSILFPFIGIIRGISSALKSLGIIESEEEKAAKERAKAEKERLLNRIKEYQKFKEQRHKDLLEERAIYEDKVNHEIALARAQGKNTEEMEREKRKELLRSNELEQQVIAQRIAALLEELKVRKEINLTVLAEQKKNLDELQKQQKEGQARIIALNREQEIADAQSQTQRTKDAKKAAEERQRIAEQEKQKQLELQRTYEDLLIANIEDDNLRAIRAMEMQHKREREELIKKYGEDSKVIAELETKQANELSALRKQQKEKLDKEADDLEKQRRAEQLLQAENDLKEQLANDLHSFDARLQMQLDFEQRKRDLLLENDQLTAEQRRQIQLDYEAKEAELNQQKVDNELATAQAINAARMSVLEQSSAIFGQLAQLGKEGGAFAKAMALTEIAANTAIGFSKGLVIAQQTAAAAGPGAAFAFPAFYASQVAAVLAAANSARKVLSSAPNISGGTGGAVSAPSMMASQPTTPNIQQGELTGNQQQQESTTKVAVLESDITRTQQRIQDIEVRTTF